MSVIEQTLKLRAKAMQPKPEFGLHMSPLTQTIYAGRAVELGGGLCRSVGQRHDVTNDFLTCVIQMGDAMKGKFAIANQEGEREVTVTKRATQAAKHQ